MVVRRSRLLLIAVGLLAFRASAQKEVSVTDFAAGENKFRDPDLGISFNLTPGWTLERATRWSNRETTLSFRDSRSQGFAGLYYESPAQREFPSNMEQAMRGAIDAKTRQRQAEGLQDYRVRPESIQSRVIGGEQAMSWVADYTGSGQKMADYFTRIRTRNSTLLLFSHMAAGELDSFRQRFEPILETLRAPDLASSARKTHSISPVASIPWHPIIWACWGGHDRSALEVPVRFDGIPAKLAMQLDTGAWTTQLRGDPRLIPRLIERPHGQTGAPPETVPLSGEIAGCPFRTSIPVFPRGIPGADPAGNILIGTLGSDFLRNRILLLDFIHQRVAILPEGSGLPPEIESAAEFLPMSVRRGQLYIPLSINGKLNYGYLYDSGSSLAALLTTRSRWQELTGRTGDEPENEREISSTWGKRSVVVGAPLQGVLSIGPAALQKPTVLFESTGLPNFDFDCYPAQGTQGLFGNRIFFDRFTVIVDMEAGRFGVLSGTK